MGGGTMRDWRVQLRWPDLHFGATNTGGAFGIQKVRGSAACRRGPVASW